MWAELRQQRTVPQLVAHLVVMAMLNNCSLHTAQMPMLQNEKPREAIGSLHSVDILHMCNMDSVPGCLHTRWQNLLTTWWQCTHAQLTPTVNLSLFSWRIKCLIYVYTQVYVRVSACFSCRLYIFCPPPAKHTQKRTHTIYTIHVLVGPQSSSSWLLKFCSCGWLDLVRSLKMFLPRL